MIKIGKYELTEDQFYGREKIDGSLYLNSLTSIPEGFNPTVGRSLYLNSLTSIPEGFNPTVGRSLDLNSLTSIPEGFNPTVGQSLYLNNLASIPEGFNPTVNGNLWLNKLTSIPEGFNPTVGRSLDLNSLTSIPEGFNPTVGGSLFLGNLTSIPEGFNPTVGGYLNLNSLTSIPKGFNPTVGGYLYLNNLASIPEGFNPTVGGYLYLNNLASIPEGLSIDEHQNKHIPFISWQDGKYIMVDGIFTEVLLRKGNVWKVKRLHQDKEFYLVTDGNGKYAHGYSIAEARADLIFKVTDRDKSEFENLKPTDKLSFEEAIACYRVITGACSTGVRQFVKDNDIEQRDYTIAEMIEITSNSYGNQQFREFFN